MFVSGGVGLLFFLEEDGREGGGVSGRILLRHLYEEFEAHEWYFTISWVDFGCVGLSWGRCTIFKS